MSTYLPISVIISLAMAANTTANMISPRTALVNARTNTASPDDATFYQHRRSLDFPSYTCDYAL